MGTEGEVTIDLVGFMCKNVKKHNHAQETSGAWNGMESRGQ